MRALTVRQLSAISVDDIEISLRSLWILPYLGWLTCCCGTLIAGDYPE
jgi:hypothetical protein